MVHSSQWCASSTFLQSSSSFLAPIWAGKLVTNQHTYKETYSTGNENIGPSNWSTAGSPYGAVHCHL